MGLHALGWLKKEKLLTPKYKYIYTTHFDTIDFRNFARQNETKELHDLKAEPGGTNNLAYVNKQLASHFQGKIDRFINQALENQAVLGEKEEKAFTKEEGEAVQQRLKDLGY